MCIGDNCHDLTKQQLEVDEIMHYEEMDLPAFRLRRIGPMRQRRTSPPEAGKNSFFEITSNPFGDMGNTLGCRAAIIYPVC